MNAVVLSVIFLFGLIIGSFLNVVILRNDATLFTSNTGNPSSLRGRSRCFACGHVLAWYELIPLVSFIIQNGRCRTCKEKISLQYPIVELLTGILFFLVWLKVVESRIMNYELWFFGYWSLFFSLLLAIAVYDFRTKIIPDRFVYPLIVLGAMYPFLIDAPSASIIADWIAAVSAAAFFAFLWLVSRGRWIGFGDAKLTLGLGFFLGWPLVFLALLFAFWSAALVGIGLVAWKGYGRKSEIPFGPFLALGTLTAFLVGEKILMWYSGIIP
jgi:leader peptidase (prepilin peptidase) / N-methyltransferase